MEYEMTPMKAKVPVSEIMTREVLTVDVDQSLREAEKLMKTHKIRHIPVLAKEKLVGILSLNDLLRLSFVDSYGYEEEESVDTTIFNMLTIEQVMITRPKTVLADQSIKSVAETFTQEDFHALPVVENDRLVGIVTTTDVIRFLLANCK